MKLKFALLLFYLFIIHWLVGQSPLINRLHTVSSIQTDTFSYQEKVDVVRSALNAINTIKDDSLKAKVLQQCGNIYSRHGSYNKAIDLYLESSRIFKRISLYEEYCEVQINIAELYLDMHDPDRMLKLVRPLKKFSIAQNLPLVTGLALLFEGNYYINLENIDSAQLVYQQALNNFKNADWSHQAFSALNTNLALIHLHKNKPGLAIPLYDSLITLAKQQKNQLDIAKLYRNLGIAYTLKEEFNKATTYFDSSIVIALTYHFPEVLSLAYRGKSNIMISKHDYQQAYFYLNKYYEIKDSLVYSQLKELLLEHESRDKLNEHKNTIQGYEDEITHLMKMEKTLRRNLIYILAILNIVFLIAILLYSRQANKLKNNQLLRASERALSISKLREQQLQEEALKAKLNSRKKDMTNLALTIKSKDILAQKLTHKLEELQKTHPGEIKAKVNDIIRFANSQLQINQEVEILQQNIDSVNEEFYLSLDHQFNGLTQNEKKLCGMIRLNLSNKEIANIRGISVSSAKMNRYRLRKKLGLDPNEDIVDYLQKL